MSAHIPVFIEPTPPEVFYCGVETRAASWYVDPSPAEYCETEVANDGELCPRHDDDEPDWDDIREERRWEA